MSAFFNKQVVRDTQRVVKKFALDKCEAFDKQAMLVDLVSILRDPASILTGFSIADMPDRALGAERGGSDELDEKTADDLSLVLEGSIRSRANIVTYCSPGAMQSSMQNYRYGQLNFQSSIQQVTLDGFRSKNALWTVSPSASVTTRRNRGRVSPARYTCPQKFGCGHPVGSRAGPAPRAHRGTNRAL